MQVHPDRVKTEQEQGQKPLSSSPICYVFNISKQIKHRNRMMNYYAFFILPSWLCYIRVPPTGHNQYSQNNYMNTTITKQIKVTKIAVRSAPTLQLLKEFTIEDNMDKGHHYLTCI